MDPYQLIDQLQKKAIPVQHSCRVLEASRYGYCDARRRPAKPLLGKAGIHLKAALPTVIEAMAVAVW